MFSTTNDLQKYVRENYPEVTDSRIDDSHWDLLCTNCKVTRGFQVTQSIFAGYSTEYSAFTRDFSAPVTYWFRCPVCKCFKSWLVFQLKLTKDAKGSWITQYFRVTSFPSEGLEDIQELPQDPPTLRAAYREAIRAMDANANLAAAAMFRRALQVITRELLGAKPGSLANELSEVVGKEYRGGIVRSNFAEIGYIIKEAGNRAAHPDKDPDLLDFTSQDAEDLQRIFMELVSELFVIPAAVLKAKEDFMVRNKIVPKGANPVRG